MGQDIGLRERIANMLSDASQSEWASFAMPGTDTAISAIGYAIEPDIGSPFERQLDSLQTPIDRAFSFVIDKLKGGSGVDTPLSPRQQNITNTILSDIGISENITEPMSLSGSDLSYWFEKYGRASPTSPVYSQADTVEVILDNMSEANKQAQALYDRGYRKISSSDHFILDGEDKTGRPIKKYSGNKVEQWSKVSGAPKNITVIPDPINIDDSGFETDKYIRENNLDSNTNEVYTNSEFIGMVQKSVLDGAVPTSVPEMALKGGGELVAALGTLGQSAIAIEAQENYGMMKTDGWEGALNAVTFAFPPFTALFGAPDVYAGVIFKSLTSGPAGRSLFKSNYRALYNWVAKEPDLDISTITPDMVNKRKIFQDQGIPEDMVELTMNMWTNAGAAKGNPNLLFENTAVRVIPDIDPKSPGSFAIEATNKHSNQSTYFKISPINADIDRRVRQTTEEFLDFVDNYSESIGSRFPDNFGGYNPKDKTFKVGSRDTSGNSLIKTLFVPRGKRGQGGRGAELPINDLFGEYSGLNVSLEEMKWIGLEDWLTTNYKPQNRIKMTELREFVEKSRMKLVMWKGNDHFGSPEYGAVTAGPNLGNNTVLLTQIDIANLPDDSTIKHMFHPFRDLTEDMVEDEDIEGLQSLFSTFKGHYSEQLTIVSRDPASTLSEAEEITDFYKFIPEEVMTPTITGKTKVPITDRNNIFMTARYQSNVIYEDGVPKNTMEILEIQTDVLDTDIGKDAFKKKMSVDFKSGDTLPGRSLTWTGMGGAKWNFQVNGGDITITPLNNSAMQRGVDTAPFETMLGKLEMLSQRSGALTVNVIDHPSQAKFPLIGISFPKETMPWGDVSNIDIDPKVIDEMLEVIIEGRPREILPRDIRWSKEQLLNGESGFQIIPRQLGDDTVWDIYDGPKLASGENVIADTLASEDDAVYTLWSMLDSMHKDTIHNNAPLPPNLIFDKGWHMPILREGFVHGAMSGKSYITIDSAGGVMQSYGDAALKYSGTRYGEAVGEFRAQILPTRIQNSIKAVRRAVDEGVNSWKKSPKEPTIDGMPIREIPEDFRAGVEADPQLESMGMRLERQTPIEEVRIDDVRTEVALEAETERVAGLANEMERRGVKMTPDIRGEIDASQDALGQAGKRVNSLLYDAIAKRHGGKSITKFDTILDDSNTREMGFALDELLVDDPPMGSTRANQLIEDIENEAQGILDSGKPKNTGTLIKGAQKIVGDILRMSGHSSLKNEHAKILIGAKWKPTGVMEVTPEELINPFGFTDEQLQIIGLNKPPTNAYFDLRGEGPIHERIEKLSWMLGYGDEPGDIYESFGYRLGSYVFSDQEADTQAAKFLQRAIDNLDDIPYKLDVEDNDMGRALLNVFDNVTAQSVIDKLDEGFTTADDARSGLLNDAISALDQETISELSEDATSIGLIRTELETGRYAHLGLVPPKVLNNYESGPSRPIQLMMENGDIEIRQGFSHSVKNHLELAGLATHNVRYSSSQEDILETILDAALDVALESGTISSKSDLIDHLGMNPLAKLSFGETDKGRWIHSIDLNKSIVDDQGNYIPELGLKGKPNSKFPHAPTTLGEAIRVGYMRLYQTTDELPIGGRILGFTDIFSDGTYLVSLTKSADFRTAIHEYGHVLRRNLTNEQLKVAGEFSMGPEVFNALDNKNIWTREGEEAFADAFELYVTTGYAKTRELKNVFEVFKDWLIKTYRSIRGTELEENLSPELKAMFDDLARPVTPSNRKIKNNVLEHEEATANAFFGNKNKTVRIPEDPDRLYRKDHTTVDRLALEPDEVIRKRVRAVRSVGKLLEKHNLTKVQLLKAGYVTKTRITGSTGRVRTEYRIHKKDVESYLRHEDRPKPSIEATDPAIINLPSHDAKLSWHQKRAVDSLDPPKPQVIDSKAYREAGKPTFLGNYILKYLAKHPKSSVDNIYGAIVKESQSKSSTAWKKLSRKAEFYNRGQSKFVHPSDRRPQGIPNKARIERELTRVTGTRTPGYVKGPKFLYDPIGPYVEVDEDGLWSVMPQDRLYKIVDDEGTPPKGIDEAGQVTPPIESLSSLQNIENVISANFIVNNYRRLAQTPGLKHIISRLNPASAANDPLSKSLIAHAMLKEEGKQKAEIAFTRLSRLGSQRKVFGELDDTGRIAEGPLRGKNVNDIRSNYSEYESSLSEAQKEWVQIANAIEDAKLAMFRAEGIDINELAVTEGGHYAGRRLMGRVFVDGEYVDIGVVAGPGRPGTRSAQEKERYFETAEEAIEAGYRYLDDDEALLMNLQAAYRRVADKRAVDHIVNNVVSTRTTGAPEELIQSRGLAGKRLAAAKTLIEEIQRAKRGGQITAQARKSIENMLPEIEGMLGDTAAISLEQLIKAGRIAEDQPSTFVPQKGMIKALFRRVQELEQQIDDITEAGMQVPSELYQRLNKMRGDLGFQKHMVAEAYANYKAYGTFEYTWSKSATSILVADRVGALDEILELVRGKPVIGTTSGGKQTTYYRGGLVDSLKAEKAEIDLEISNLRLEQPKLFEGSLGQQVPAFAGKFFTKDQPLSLRKPDGSKMRGIDVQRAIGQAMVDNREFSEALNSINTANSMFRFFQLAGDMSAFGIQLLFLWGQTVRNPLFMAKAMKGFVSAFVDPTFHQNYIHNHRELLSKHPGMMISTGGTEFTEFTRLMANAGFVRTKPIRVSKEVLERVPGLPQAGRTYVGLLKRAQSGFETALDVAGIEMAKAFEGRYSHHADVQQIDDFINEFRGLANPARLGVSTKQRQLETLALLAPRYNRAIAAMLGDVFSGNIRGNEARKTLAAGIGSIMAMAVAISFAKGEDPEEVAEHFNPTSPMFMTWNVGGTNIGVGSKVRSLIKLGGGIYATGSGDDPIDLFTLSMDNPGIRFVRGNASPVVGSAIDILSGRTYMGDPVYGGSPWDIKGHIINFTKEEIAPKTMPIWAQAVVLEGGNPQQRAIKGLVEFVGGRAYPQGSFQMLRGYAQEHVGIDYEDMEPFERRILREYLSDELDPMLLEKVKQGDKDAQYWLAIKQLDEERFSREEALLKQFMNPRKYPRFLVRGAQVLRQEFSDLQEQHATQKASLNKQFGMYQDDQTFDKNDPKKFILSEWYNLYDKATDPDSGAFDYERLQALQRNFYKKTLPNGDSYNQYKDFIIRNTSNTRHPKGYETVMSRNTVERWQRAEEARVDFLRNRGKWSNILDSQ